MKNAFNWGVIGPGRIAHRFADALTVVDHSKLYAVASRDEDRAKSFAEQYGAPTVYTQYEQMVNDPNVDGIYIATPHRFHFDQALLCLSAKKPLLCEKPLTVNAQQTAQLIEASTSHQTFLMEALWSRFLPVYQQAKAWISEGKIGDILHVTSQFGFKFPHDLNDRIYNEALAGGILLDGGVYNIAMTQWILEQLTPTQIQATGVIGPSGVDESLMANLMYSDGVWSQFNCSIKSTLRNELTIHGTEGHIIIHPMFWDTTKATLKNEEGEFIVTKPFDKNGFEYQIREVMSCVEAGSIESSVMPHGHSLANMQVMDEIRQQLGLVYSFE